MDQPALPIDSPVRLDLRGTPCPLNFIRAKLALERLDPGQWLQLDLDRGEPEQMVAAGLRQAGHSLRIEPHPDAPSQAARLLVRRDGL